MDNKRLILAHASFINKDAPLYGNKLFVLTNAGLISGTPVWSDEELDDVTVIPRSILQTFYKAALPKERETTNAHMLCGDDDVFLLQKVTLYSASNTIDIDYLFVRYDSVIGCLIGK